jgi:hypothetical protein
MWTKYVNGQTFFRRPGRRPRVNPDFLNGYCGAEIAIQ